ncbi:MAG: hypothetical protein WBA10_03225, partial [Elainellaceae cyanobacterium]
NSLTVWEDLRWARTSPERPLSQQGPETIMAGEPLDEPIAQSIVRNTDRHRTNPHSAWPIEAQGWNIDQNGHVVLMAQPAPGQPLSPWQLSAAPCMSPT